MQGYYTCVSAYGPFPALDFVIGYGDELVSSNPQRLASKRGSYSYRGGVVSINGSALDSVQFRAEGDGHGKPVLLRELSSRGDPTAFVCRWAAPKPPGRRDAKSADVTSPDEAATVRYSRLLGTAR